jgi:hypothetical protein
MTRHPLFWAVIAGVVFWWWRTNAVNTALNSQEA